MSYVVVWNLDAADEVDEAWDLAPIAEQERMVTSLAANEHLLRKDPMQVGESREVKGKRVVTHSPVTVHFRVDMIQRLVRVYAARVYRQGTA